MSIRNIAFYLPQFYPFKENDVWWGKGFTEWTNVTKAKPLFEGHYQPHLPTDLGFYDLRVRETHYEQIKLAKQYGIHGFCYHYYWFSGKRLLDKPLDAMLADPKADLPFMLCWANENWTRRWDASEKTVLISQHYREDDDLNFIKSVIPYFIDSRYIRVDGAPALIVYRPQHLPDASKTLRIWREYCKSIGIRKIHLISAMVHGNTDYEQYGFDAGVQFPPHAPEVRNISSSIDFFNDHQGMTIEFADLAMSYLGRKYRGENVYRTVFPSWDNTARVSERALIVLNGTPQNYEYWLRQATKYTREYFSDDGLVFINAWNEWAEGCHLEPDRRYGRQFLEATARVVSGTSEIDGFPDRGIPLGAEASFNGLIGYKRSIRNILKTRLLGRINWLRVKFPMLGRIKRFFFDR